MAILEANPIACLLAMLDQGFSLLTLTLPQGDEVKPLLVLEILGKLHQVVCWVSASRQNKDQGHCLLGVLETANEVEVGGDCVVLSQLCSDKVSHYQLKEVLPKRLDDQQLLEGRQLLCPHAWQVPASHVIVRAEVLPRRCEHVLCQALKDLAASFQSQLLQYHHLPVALRRHPRRRFDCLRQRVIDNAFAGLEAAQKEAPLLWGDALLVHELRMDLVAQASVADHEGIQQLVVLEQAHANLCVDELSEVLDDDVDALVDVFCRGAGSQSLLKEAGEELQAVLIHGVDVGEVGHDEVNDRSPRCTGSQDFRHLIDLLHTQLG
mmetsp:Transcript_62957/g.150430  ORF Transcript_62957/g.150430 Transcript_62957/m.150430 type:complete len:322 (+) Transcript_62957:154-1119(+)